MHRCCDGKFRKHGANIDSYDVVVEYLVSMGPILIHTQAKHRRCDGKFRKHGANIDSYDVVVEYLVSMGPILIHT